MIQHSDTLPTGWQNIKLSDLAKRGSGHTPNRRFPEYWNGSIKWVSLADSSKLDKKWIRSTAHEISVKGIANSSAVMHPAGAVILSRDAGVGKSAILAEPMAVSQHFMAWECGENLNNFFLYYTLQNRKKEFERVASGSTIKTIGLGYFIDLCILLPPLEEQARIVEILDEADAAVRAADALINAKIRCKNAVAERLLDGAGKGWQVSTIGQIASQRVEKNPSNEGYPVLSCTKHRGLVLSSDYFAKRIHSENVTGYKVVRRSWFAYATNHIEEGSIGLLNLCDAGLVSPMYTVFEPDSSRIDCQFLFALLKTNKYLQKYIALTSASVNRRGSLRWVTFAAISLLLPPLREQQEIAETLNLMDEEIRLLKQQRDAQNRLKQALMQKLLTGELRTQEAAP